MNTARRNTAIAVLILAMVAATSRPTAAAELTFFWAGATLEAPGLDWQAPNCEGYDPDPVGYSVAVDVYYEYEYEDGSREYIGSDPTGYSGAGFTWSSASVPSENDVLLDTATAAVGGAAAREVANRHADDIANAIRSGSGSVGGGNFFTKMFTSGIGQAVKFIGSRATAA